MFTQHANLLAFTAGDKLRTDLPFKGANTTERLFSIKFFCAD